MVEDGSLEPAELRARFEAELVTERAPGRLVLAERVGLAAGPVQRQHQQLADPLPQGMLVGEGLELGGDLPMVTERQSQLGPELSGTEAELAQAGDLTCREVPVRHIAEWFAPPEGQGLLDATECVAPLLDAVVVGQPTGPVDERLEAPGVDR